MHQCMLAAQHTSHPGPGEPARLGTAPRRAEPRGPVILLVPADAEGAESQESISLEE